jgi:hypothetical protein
MKMDKQLIYGLGVNDANYPVHKYENGSKKTTWRCPYYLRWVGVIKRATSGLDSEYPTYEQVKVCDEWINFSNFRRWMIKQDWENKELDKDLLSEESKIYSPETCVFIDMKLNSYLQKYGNSNVKMFGVTYESDRNKFRAYHAGKSLGRFKTPEEAHKAWQEAKYKRGIELLSEQTDPRVIAGMHKLLYNLAEDIRLGRETKKLSSNIQEQTLDTTKTNT